MQRSFLVIDCENELVLEEITTTLLPGRLFAYGVRELHVLYRSRTYLGMMCSLYRFDAFVGGQVSSPKSLWSELFLYLQACT
jgi:hypothetical protein